MGHAGTATARVHPGPCRGRGGRARPDGCRTVAHLDSQPGRTPLLAVDLEVVLARYRQVSGMVPAARPLVPRSRRTRTRRSSICSYGRARRSTSPPSPRSRACLAAGARPTRSASATPSRSSWLRRRGPSFGGTALRVRLGDGAGQARRRGTRAPPGSCRIAGDCRGAAWPLSGKFGCSADEAVGLLEEAARNGLRTGVSFHPGSQQANRPRGTATSPSWPGSGRSWRRARSTCTSSTSAADCPVATTSARRPSPATAMPSPRRSSATSGPCRRRRS